jgi:hypothetical protein
MKKIMNWAMAAALIISGLSVFSACGSDNDDENKPPVVQPDDNGSNSGDNGNDNNLNDVTGNVNINNGGGGVNEVR